MRVGEVGLLTNDVVKLANFYKLLLETENGSNNSVHQTILAEETMLTIPFLIHFNMKCAIQILAISIFCVYNYMVMI